MVNDDREYEHDKTIPNVSCKANEAIATTGDGAAVGFDDKSTSSSEFDPNLDVTLAVGGSEFDRSLDQVLTEGDRSVSSSDDDQDYKDLSTEIDHLLDEAMETPYDGVAIGVDEESASAAGGDRNVEDHEYEDNLRDVSYALTGRLDGIIETPDDGTRRSVAGEGDRQECEDDEGMFPDVLYSPAGMPLDTVMETQCDSSERSSVDHEEEYSVGEEQMPNYGVLDMSDEREIAGNKRQIKKKTKPLKTTY